MKRKAIQYLMTNVIHLCVKMHHEDGHRPFAKALGPSKGSPNPIEAINSPWTGCVLTCKYEMDDDEEKAKKKSERRRSLHLMHKLVIYIALATSARVFILAEKAKI